MLQWLPWTDAAALAGAGAAATAATGGGRAPRLHPWGRELTLMLALYGLWQYAGAWSLGRVAAARSRGLAIWRLERHLHLPSERDLQGLLLHHHLLARLADEWYAEVHVPALGVALVWLFVRHRERYAPVRTAVVAVTAASLAVALWPVAPPRLLPQLHVADVAALVGPSTYAGGAPGIDQLSAMPSLHVGWALLVAGAVVWAGRSRWRWLALAHPAVTVWVVVATGNHFWADGIVAAGLCLAAALGVRRAYAPFGPGTSIAWQRSPAPSTTSPVPSSLTPSRASSPT